MANKAFFPIDFKQDGNVCLLASLSVCIGYYKKVEKGVGAQLRFKNLCKRYLDYMTGECRGHNSLDLEEKIDNIRRVSSIGRGKAEIEELIHGILLFYCQDVRGDIRGYQHIFEFDNFLRENQFEGFPTNYKCFLVFAEENAVTDSHYRIIDDLEREEDNLAMVFYNNHSIVIGNGGTDIIYKRDTNNNEVDEILKSDFTIDSYPISEYILFQRID